MNALPSETDFIVVGAGIAGLRASVELASAGRVLCLAKREVTESNTQYAQGGIAAALSDDDEVRLHLEDTLKAGDGLVNEEAARVLVEEGPPRIEELIEWGTEFDRAGAKIAFTREGAHSRSRVLHAHGDSTGREIGRALYLKAAGHPAITFCEFEFTTDLLVAMAASSACACSIRPGRSTRSMPAPCCWPPADSATFTATPPIPRSPPATEWRWRYRAGAEISDMEFVQFHPTALYLKGAPRFLLSEALRGEGAYLRNLELKRFMPKYHELAELAPRDVVARAITHELDLVKRPDAAVYLDLTHLDAERVRKRFPNDLRHLHALQHRHCDGAGAHPPGGALRHGRRAHRSVGTHVASRALCRRRGGVYRRARRESPGQQLAAGRSGVRSARRAGYA